MSDIKCTCNDGDGCYDCPNSKECDKKDQLYHDAWYGPDMV